MAINWYPATIYHISDIHALAKQYQSGMSSIFRIDDQTFLKNLSVAVVKQTFNAYEDNITVFYEDNKLVAWAWITRGINVAFSSDQIAESKFLHTDPLLKTKTKISIINTTLDLWEKWALLTNCQVIVSTSVLDNYEAFMRLHERKGYKVFGGNAFRRLSEVSK